jgi:hypothetical protein
VVIDIPASPSESADRWFGKATGGFSLRPLNWKGRFSLALWVVLCLLALVLYTSQLGLMLFVIVLYTTIFAGVVFLKSDLRAEIEHRTNGTPDQES